MTKLSIETAPRHPHGTAGVTIQAPYLFTPGHELTEAEARFMNGHVAGDVANYHSGYARREAEKRTKEALDAWTKGGKKGPKPVAVTVADLGWDHQAEYDKRFAAFEPGTTATRTGTSADPLEREIHRLASEEVKKLLRAKKLKISDFFAAKDDEGVSKFDKLVAQYRERNEWLKEVAAENVARVAERSSAGDMSDLLDGVELPEASPTETEEEAA